MVKIVVAVIVAVVLLNVAWFALKVALLVLLERNKHKKYENPFGYKSEYREAFVLECSETDIKGNPYAENLDKCIKRIDREAERLENARKKSREMLSKIKMPEY